MGVLVLAEPGSTAEGRHDAFIALVQVAASIGCDIFKNQWVSSPERLCERRRAPEYLQAYEKIAYPSTTHEWLGAKAREHGLAYACSVYLPEDVEVVEPYCDYLKCASFESTDPGMRDALWPYRHKTIISLGMGAAVDQWFDFFAMLHCISAYPVPVEQMNLTAIRTRGLDGLSDHSRHPWVGAIAVGIGVRLIEFHIRLWDTDPRNADYQVARTPAEAREYVGNIRLAEKMLGSGDRRAMPCEEPMLRYRVRS